MTDAIQARRVVKAALADAGLRWEFSVEREGARYHVVFRRGTTTFSQVVDLAVLADRRGAAVTTLIEDARRLLHPE